MAEFCKGKATDNPKFIKSTPVEHGAAECARLRGLSGNKASGEVTQLGVRFMEALKSLTKIGKK